MVHFEFLTLFVMGAIREAALLDCTAGDAQKDPIDIAAEGQRMRETRDSSKGRREKGGVAPKRTPSSNRGGGIARSEGRKGRKSPFVSRRGEVGREVGSTELCSCCE